MQSAFGFFLIVCLAPTIAFGHGFANYVQGGRSFATGGAFTAVADDSSAIFYNPAGIQQLGGSQIMLGFGNFFPAGGKFSSSGTSNIPGSAAGITTKTDSDNHFAPYLYATLKKATPFLLVWGCTVRSGRPANGPMIGRVATHREA